MNDFLNGWSQGMTGSSSGQPSQSVLEAMGRDAARNQWNNNNTQQHGGGGYQVAKGGVPVTTVLYKAGQKMRLKTLARDFGISVGLVLLSALVFKITPRPLDWVAELIAIPGYIWGFWTILRLPFYLIAKVGSLIKGPEKTSQEDTPAEKP